MQKSILLVDDDKPFLNQLARSLARHGFISESATTTEQAVVWANNQPFDYALVDMRIGSDNGLNLVPKLLAVQPDMRIVMLTGYGNIASAVSAVKVGAVDYLAKPAPIDSIINALTGQETMADELSDLPENIMSADRVKWEHIWRVYEQCDRNVSETARQLKMHRRSLQRILSKHAPPN